jgi:hypothetical protein
LLKTRFLGVNLASVVDSCIEIFQISRGGDSFAAFRPK